MTRRFEERVQALSQGPDAPCCVSMTRRFEERVQVASVLGAH